MVCRTRERGTEMASPVSQADQIQQTKQRYECKCQVWNTWKLGVHSATTIQIVLRSKEKQYYDSRMNQITQSDWFHMVYRTGEGGTKIGRIENKI